MKLKVSSPPPSAYIDDLFDQVGNAALGENLALRGFVGEQDVEGSILVGICSFIEGAVGYDEKSGQCKRFKLQNDSYLLDHLVVVVDLEIVEGIARSDLAFQGWSHAHRHPDFVVFVRSFQVSHSIDPLSNWLRYLSCLLCLSDCAMKNAIKIK